MLEEEQKVEKKFRLRSSPKMIKFKSLNRSKDFLKILKKKKLNTKYYTIYFDKNSKNIKKHILKDALEFIKPLKSPRVKNTTEIDDEKTNN